MHLSVIPSLKFPGGQPVCTADLNKKQSNLSDRY